MVKRDEVMGKGRSEELERGMKLSGEEGKGEGKQR